MICLIDGYYSEINDENIPIKYRRDEYYVNVTFRSTGCFLILIINDKVVFKFQTVKVINNMDWLNFGNLKNAFVNHLDNLIIN